MSFSKQLNPSQLDAATSFFGPLIVFAGAGSGKTLSLTMRIVNMLKSGIKDKEILAITFTNKATNEMKSRINDCIGLSNVTISTFHAFAARLLRHEIHVLGYKNNFTIIDEEDQLRVIKDVIDAENIDKKRYPASSVRKEINRMKCFSQKPETEIEKRLLHAYEKEMKEECALDFHDLLLKTKKILEEFPDILDKYQNRYRYILVDEFQDTNLIQYEIVRMLAEKHRNLFVVGDDDQAIYSFRGTNYENFALFKKDFPEYRMIVLNENYRSQQSILLGANNLIKHNTNRENKTMFSSIPGNKDNVIIYQAKSEVDEANFIADKITYFHRYDNKAYHDFAVLYRLSALSRNIERALIEHKIPYKIYGGISYLRRKEVKDIIAYLRFIIDDTDIISFKRIARNCITGIGNMTIFEILEVRKKMQCGILDAIYAMKSLGKRKQLLYEFSELILSLREEINKTDLVTFFDIMLEKTDYERQYLYDDDYPERCENIAEFRSILKVIDESGEIADNTVKLQSAFDEAILSEDRLQDRQERKDAVILSTVHSAKGLEFDTVFLTGFEQGLFPSWQDMKEKDLFEEERRIAYVAITRAKDRLFLTYSTERLIYGKYMHTKPSCFLSEFRSDANLFRSFNLEKEKGKTPQKAEQVDPLAYNVGDHVEHKIYGQGIIVAYDKEKLAAKICFPDQYVIKEFRMTTPAIKKIINK